MFTSLITMFTITYVAYMYIVTIDVKRLGYALGSVNVVVGMLLYLLLIDPKISLALKDHTWYFIVFFILELILVITFNFICLTMIKPWLMSSRYLGHTRKIVDMSLWYSLSVMFVLFALSPNKGL